MIGPGQRKDQDGLPWDER